jgi:hypothetical protein
VSKPNGARLSIGRGRVIGRTGLGAGAVAIRPTPLDWQLSPQRPAGPIDAAHIEVVVHAQAHGANRPASDRGASPGRPRIGWGVRTPSADSVAMPTDRGRRRTRRSPSPDGSRRRRSRTRRARPEHRCRRACKGGSGRPAVRPVSADPLRAAETVVGKSALQSSSTQHSRAQVHTPASQLFRQAQPAHATPRPQKLALAPSRHWVPSQRRSVRAWTFVERVHELPPLAFH